MDKINNRPILKTGNLIIGYESSRQIPHVIKEIEGDKITVLDIFSNEKEQYSISEFYSYFEQDINTVKMILAKRIAQYKSAISSETNNFVKDAQQNTLTRLVNYANKAVKIEQMQNSVTNGVVLKISEMSDNQVIDLIMFLGLSNHLHSQVNQADVFNRKDNMQDYLLFLDGKNEIHLITVTEKIGYKQEGYKIKEAAHRFDFFTLVNNLAPITPR